MPVRFSDEAFAAKIEHEKIETFAQLAKLIRQSCVGDEDLEIYIAASIPKTSSVCVLSENINHSKNIVAPEQYVTLFRFNASKYVYDQSIKHEKILILSTHQVEFGTNRIGKVLIRNLTAFVLKSRQTKLRNAVVEISYAASDYNSFGYRIIQNLIRPHFRAEGGTDAC